MPTYIVVSFECPYCELFIPLLLKKKCVSLLYVYKYINYSEKKQELWGKGDIFVNILF